MLYYSESLKKAFKTEKECLDAEFKAKEAENLEKIRKERELAARKEKEEKLAAERKSAAAELDETRKAMVAAQKKYADLLSDFTKKYGTYHYSINSLDEIPTLFSSFISDWL